MKGQKAIIIMVFIMGLAIGIMIGFMIGYGMALDWAVDKALIILNVTEDQLQLGKNELLNAVFRYKNHIGK